MEFLRTCVSDSEDDTMLKTTRKVIAALLLKYDKIKLIIVDFIFRKEELQPVCS